MHDPVASVDEWLKRVTLGYYNYYAVPGRMRERVRTVLCGGRSVMVVPTAS